MRWFIFSLILLVGALLDAGNLLSLIALGTWHTRPEILFIVLIFVSLNTRPTDAIQCAFAVGFAADIVSGAIGPHMVCYGIVGTLINGGTRLLSMQRGVFQAIVVFFFFFLTDIPASLLDAWKQGQSYPDLFWRTLGTSLYTAIASPFVWIALSHIWKLMGHRPEIRQGSIR